MGGAGETGVLFAPEDPAALSEAVVGLLGRDLAAMGRAAATAVRRERLWTATSPAWLDAYRAALDQFAVLAPGAVATRHG